MGFKMGRLEIPLMEFGGGESELHVHGEWFFRGLSWEGNVTDG
jgi:hypothetical protein